jgi:asparagine synthase (glutamine-hydrolysing)
MCGITGSLGVSSREKILSLMNLISHRGPDADGIFVSDDDSCAFGHARLSIMDPKGGNQPIFNEKGDKVIVANGEIYNFPRLKTEISNHHKFSTVSDSEAILHMFEVLLLQSLEPGGLTIMFTNTLLPRWCVFGEVHV